MGGGFRPGVVYRVTLQPVVRDMFGNTLRDPFELVFDTGAEPEETAVAGEVWDRITGRGVPDASVQAVGPDSLVHVSTSESIFLSSASDLTLSAVIRIPAPCFFVRDHAAEFSGVSIIRGKPAAV